MLSVNFYIYLQLFMYYFLHDQKLKMKDVAASSANDWVIWAYDIGSYRLKAPELNLIKIVSWQTCDICQYRIVVQRINIILYPDTIIRLLSRIKLARFCSSIVCSFYLTEQKIES